MTSGAYKIESYYLTHCRNEREFSQNIKAIDLKDIKEIRRKSFIPKRKTLEELHNEVKLKKSWKNAGPGNSDFEKMKALKGKVLDYWTASRVNMPLRSYERYPVSRAIHAGFPGKEFGYDQEGKLFTEQFKKVLTEHKKKFDYFVERPSKFDKKEYFLPELVSSKPKWVFKKSEFEDFKFSKHSTFISENKYRIEK